jgi:hypothetical protein
MRKKMSRLAWALLILAGGLTAAFTPTNVDALTCRQAYNECVAGCDPADSFCSEGCQCEFLTCKGLACN